MDYSAPCKPSSHRASSIDDSFGEQGHELYWDILSSMLQRIGVFGGTFDPPHLGHLILAAEARAQLRLDRLLWVLTALPPHKIGETITPLEDRLAMVKLALQDEPAFELSTVDIDRPGPHYTLDTIKILRNSLPTQEIILVIGGDSLHDLPRWHRPRDLVAACDEIGVMRRPADSVDLTALEAELPRLTSKVRFVDAPLLEIASHEIRERVLRGLPFRYFVAPGVYSYIIKHRLYQSA
jgi:nicotinate-nucleotide adenylyltransferase